MKTVEEYAIELVVQGTQSRAEDDLNENGGIAEEDHPAAQALALKLADAIRDNPDDVLSLVGRASWQRRKDG